MFGIAAHRRTRSDSLHALSFAQRARRSLAPFRNGLYSKYEHLRAAFSPRRGLRVLMSEKPEWHEGLKIGFAGTRHEVQFRAISPDNLGEFDLVVPLTTQDLLQACRFSSLLIKNPIPIPSERCVMLCNDKYKFNETLISAGFGEYIPRIGAKLDPPYILKKRIGCWGQDCHMIHTREDELAFLEKVNDPAFFCQEIIKGTREFATHILFVNDRIVKSLNIMYEFEQDTPIKGQARSLYLMIHRCPYLRLFSSILKSIRFQGLCCLNYKVADRRPYLLEINPRFGGSLAPYFFSFIRHLTQM
jgi:hypothetical protein